MKTDKKTFDFKWAGRIFILSFTISAVLSSVSEGLTASLNVWVAVLILFFFIFIGVLFDIIGISVTVADPVVFNSMAARKVKGATVALRLISNADAVANFCNDVIGDIAGVLSGTMCLAISGELAARTGWNSIILTVVMSALTSALMISCKALGKNFAMKNCSSIVFFFSKLISIFSIEKKKSRK